MSLRRFEYSDGKSNKFWEVEVAGTSCTVRYGRIGTDGREQTTPCGSAAGATREAERMIRSKLKKGYVEVSADDAAGGAEEEESVDDSPKAALERKLAASADDYDSWLVYADMLSNEGDPRGEYVTLGVALDKALAAKQADEVERLRLREWDLLRANAKAWFGKTVSDDDWRECFGWEPQMGFWRRIRVWLDYDHKHVDIPKLLAHALSLDSAKFVRNIELGLPNAEGSADYTGCIKAMVKAGKLPSLRQLTIGDFVRDESEISWVHVGDVNRLWKTLPALETLTLRGAGIDLGTPKSDSLRWLALETGGLRRQAGESLARAKLPALRHLEVWFGSPYYGANCSAQQVKGILANDSFAKLEYLGLMNADFADDIAREIARAELPAGLQTLDLSMGTMSDKGAKALIKAKDKLKGLKRIKLDENGISAELCARLSKALPNATTTSQKSGEDANYVSVGE